MKLLLFLPALFAYGLSQAFEPADFDVGTALLNNGVDVSAIPALAGLTQRSLTDRCSIATVFGSKVLFDGAAEYKAFINSYWSAQQAAVTPRCVFLPRETWDVSIFVLLSRLTQCQFAAKSGGHAAFAGASSIANGITIAFENMRRVELTQDKKIVAIGAGNIWQDVYNSLQKHNLAVIGGRVASIGVGGLTTGGGLSFFANMYGWACDNVASFEVVTASGTIVTASPTSFPDLYWALRGGGNNFGLVTKFRLRTIPLGQMWGGDRVLLQPQFDAAVDAFINLGQNSAQDLKAAQILSFISIGEHRFASAQLEYAEANANAPIFSEWNAITPATDNTGIRSLSEITEQLNASNPYGQRQSYWTQTYKLDKDLMKFIMQVALEEQAAIADVAGLLAAVTYQVITVPQLQRMQQNGGNPLGLSPSDGPLLLINPAPAWLNAADDDRVNRYVSNILNRATAEATRRGLASDYLYMNYASRYQDVITSYGAASKRRLQEVAHKYDPTEVFQRLQPGYFKL